MSWNLRADRMSKVNIVISLESSLSMINPATKTPGGAAVPVLAN